MKGLEERLMALEQWIASGNEFAIIDMFAEMHSADIAELLDALEEEKKKKLFALLDVEQASDVFIELDDQSRTQILEDLPQDRLARIVEDMDSDEAADLIGELPKDKARRTLAQITAEDSRNVQKLLQYKEETAGGLMKVELVSVLQSQTVSEAIEKIRSLPEEVKDLHNVFVVDDRGRLVGILPLRMLILARPETKIADIMETKVISVTPEVDQEEVARMFKKYDVVSMPVVDTNGLLLGHITVDDVVEVMEEEASEDLFKMAGTDEDELVYRTKILKIVRMRLPWLITNLFGCLLTGYLMWLFKVTLREVLVLVTFIPLITGLGGSVALQSATITIRGFALGHIKLSGIWEQILRQFQVAILMGAICGALVTLLAVLWHGSMEIGLVVGASLVVSMTLANVVGSLIPAVFRKLNIDPAVASGPFITNLNDITGILIYLSIATIFINFLR